ncbi:STAS domain-containing protein [Crocinitomix algicola]|uniref:STAS domain-containing protein n=1 Tax=Crocinitomix algicola TaxID=1740263 RepID=UPI0008350330|nr:STAS domain-containing protein [Crocinitomix algicola]
MSLEISVNPRQQADEILLTGNGLIEDDFAELLQIVDERIAAAQPNLVLNLEKVKVLNSLGLNTLIKIFTKCRNNGGDMYIVNISDKINQVLLLTKLNTVLNIATSTEEAVELLN